jgi:hypothetical protein
LRPTSDAREGIQRLLPVPEAALLLPAGTPKVLPAGKLLKPFKIDLGGGALLLFPADEMPLMVLIFRAAGDPNTDSWRFRPSTEVSPFGCTLPFFISQGARKAF